MTHQIQFNITQRNFTNYTELYAKGQNKSIMVKWYAQELHRIRETGISFKHIAKCVLELVVVGDRAYE